MGRSTSRPGESVSGTRRQLLKSGVAALLATGHVGARGQAVEVALAGLAFSGDAASLDQRFPYARGYEAALNASSRTSYAALAAAIAQSPPQNFRIGTQIDELKGRDQAIAVALVITSETTSVERIAGVYKLFVLIRAQALFFDFKSLSVVRAYPISFAAIDTPDHPPTPDEIRSQVRKVFEGTSGKPGLLARFANTLASATLPTATSRYLQVSAITIKPEAMGNIAPSLSSTPALAETWAADLVGEALSTRAGIPVIPYAKGYAIGNRMSLRVSDGAVFNLVLPKPDYAVIVELSALRKIEYGKAAAGTSFIYGAYASFRIEEPLSGRVYMNTALKNGEVKLVPVTQTYVDDFPAYYDSVNNLFVKLSETLAGKSTEWVKTASAAPDIDKQIADTRELIKLCK